MDLTCGRHRLHGRARPWVMGILNVTPDSFSDGGRYRSVDQAIASAERMAAEGAHLIDVGGESTRPGASPVASKEELRRVIPVITQLSKRLRIPISIDTSKAAVASRALDAGAGLINDVTALRGDPGMAAVAAQACVPVILMHMRGTPRTMQRSPRYRDAVREVAQWLRHAARCAQEAGISANRILLDPGLGFGKTTAHNLLLLQRLDELVRLGYPVVVGPSRKSFIGRTLAAGVRDRMSGTLACAVWAVEHGAAMVRVHDVKATADALTMWCAIAASPRPRRRAETACASA